MTGLLLNKIHPVLLDRFPNKLNTLTHSLTNCLSFLSPLIIDVQLQGPRLAKVKVDGILSAPHETSVLYPEDGGNMHCFTAQNACAVLDVLGPPYDDGSGRHCQYYNVSSSAISVGKIFTWVKWLIYYYIRCYSIGILLICKPIICLDIICLCLFASTYLSLIQNMYIKIKLWYRTNPLYFFERNKSNIYMHILIPMKLYDCNPIQYSIS